jgi:hypothetical protein
MLEAFSTSIENNSRSAQIGSDPSRLAGEQALESRGIFYARSDDG